MCINVFAPNIYFRMSVYRQPRQRRERKTANEASVAVNFSNNKTAMEHDFNESQCAHIPGSELKIKQNNCHRYQKIKAIERSVTDIIGIEDASCLQKLEHNNSI